MFKQPKNVLVAALMLFGVVFWMAGCSPVVTEEEAEVHEDEHENEAEAEVHEDEHENEAMELPAITAVNLGAGEKLQVVATTNIIGDVVGNIAGDAVELTVLIGLGQNPHNYEGTPQDMAAISDAHLVFVNGLGLEEGLMESIEATASGPVVPVSAGIEVRGMGEADHEEEHEGEEGEEHEHAAGDPHFWLDPNNVIVWAENIAQVLSEADPAHAADYEANAAAYIAELEALDAYAREQLAGIPEDRRKLVTDHQAFGYFADEYGLEMIGAVVNSLSTSAEPSAADIASLVEQMQAEGVTTIFLGTSAGPRLEQLTQMVAEEAGGNVTLLTLFTGSLAPAGEVGDNYLGMIRYNIDQIAAGLGK